jgi:hypothetical protein
MRRLASIALALAASTAGLSRAEAPPAPPPVPSLETPPPAPAEKPAPLGSADDSAAAPAPPEVAPVEVPPPVTVPAEAPPAGVPVADTPAAEPIAPPEAFSIPGLPPLQIHAFASQGFIKSTKNNYLVRHATRGSFELTEAAINFTQPLTDRLRMGLQLFTSQIGGVGDFRVQADWYYLDYRFADWLGIRAGRTKVPFGLYNEINDIDAARVPILLPQAVYPLLSRDLLLAQTGLELYGYLRLGGAGGLEYRAYAGTLYAPPPVATAGTTIKDFSIPYTAGGRLMWETPLEGLRIGGSYLALRVNAAATITPTDTTMPSTDLSQKLVFHLWMASAEYALDDLLLAAEFGKWMGRLDTTAQPAMQASTVTTIEETDTRYYGMAAYRVARWLMPGVYYGGLFHDRAGLEGRQRYQHDIAATLRFDINSFWLFKLEGHYMLGTGDVTGDLNGGTALDMLADRWFVFLAKTTAYF